MLLLEPQQLIATMWQRVLGDEPSYGEVLVFGDPERALQQLRPTDMVVTGPSLSQDQAMAFTRQATLAHPGVRVVVTGIEQSEVAVVQAAESGASGLVLREESLEHALQAIQAAYQGVAHIAPQVAPVLMDRLAELRQTVPDVDTVGRRYLELTPRERQVLELIGRGRSNQQIADQLVLELGTVKNHVHRILEKLNKRSREEAAGYLRSLPPGVA